MTVVADSILTAETVPAYVQKHADKLKDVDGFGPDNTLTATAIVGGNVNYAFCVRSNETNNTIFLKQAPEFVAIFGPDGFPLTSDRMQQELDVYNEWKKMLGPELDAQYLPKIYHFDRMCMTVLMEFFEGYELLDHILVRPTLGPSDMPATIASGLGEFMGVTHAKTHSTLISEERKTYLTKHFENKPMRDVQLEFVFTKCYKESTEEQRAGLNVSEAFLKEIELLKEQYVGKCENNLVLCHGDFHPGSVMAEGTKGKAKVIDPEFTVYGPPGLDVGSLLSGYVLGAVHQVFCKNTTAAKSILEASKQIWSSYLEALKANGLTDAATLKQVEVETVGFTVAEVCRTALEFAGGRKWLQFDDKATKAAANKAALGIVDQCMIGRHEGGIQLMWDAMASAIQ